MHKFIEWIFESLINIEKFLRVFCVFLIMLLCLYWVMDLIEASWWWMGFISPLLDIILDFVNSIYSFSFNFCGNEIDIKYFNAILLIVIFIFGLKGMNIGIEKLHEIYDDTHRMYKKTKENIYNYQMNNDVKKEEKQINNYSLFIQTQISKKHANSQQDFDLNDLNRQMNRYIYDNTQIAPIEIWGGFVYTFGDFENIDDILDILFKIKNAEAPIEYIMCIQAGRNTKQLERLINLQEWGKIIIAADTLCRYEYNNTKRYKTTSVGIFQKEESTLEVHEFVEQL